MTNRTEDPFEFQPYTGQTDDPWVTDPASPPVQATTAPPTPIPYATQPVPAPAAYPAHGAEPVRAERRAQGVSWFALIFAIVASAALGFGIYRALEAIDISADDLLEGPRGWLALSVLAMFALFVALIVSIVALFRARPKLIAVLALIVTLLLPLLTIYAGLHFGIDAFVRHAEVEVAKLGGDMGDIVDYITDLIAGAGVDPGPYREFLEDVLGG